MYLICSYEVKAKINTKQISSKYRNSWRLNIPLLENDGTKKKPRKKKRIPGVEENMKNYILGWLLPTSPRNYFH